jgi:hypothetical protein
MATPRQEFGPFSFDAPVDWSCRPLLVLTDPSSPRRITVARDRRPSGEALATFAWRCLFESARSSPDRRLIEAGETKVGGQPAFRALMGVAVDPPIREATVWVDAGEGNMLVASCIMAADEGTEAFDALLSSLRLAAAGAGPTASVPPAPPSAPRSSAPPPALDESGVYAAVPMPGARATRR